MKLTVKQKKVLEHGLEVCGYENIDQVIAKGGAFFAHLADVDKTPKSNPDVISFVGGGVGTTVANKLRSGLKKYYKIDNLRQLTDKDGLGQLPYSNFIGPGTDMDSALAAGPVTAGPASVPNSNGLSADAIAKQHDIIYGLASRNGYTKEEKYKIIHDADRWMLDEVKTLPDSKTKTVIQKALEAKYKLEETSGRLVYGGGKFHKRVFKGGQFVPSSNREYYKSTIDAIINESSVVGTLETDVKTVEALVQDKLALYSKATDRQKVEENEKKLPRNKRDPVLAPTREEHYDDYVEYKDKKAGEHYDYTVSFHQDPKITNRPDVNPYLIMAPITHHNDTYTFMFPIHNRSASENAFGIDYFDGVVVTLDKTGKYHINTENNLPKSLEDLSQGNVPNGDVLRKYGVLDSEGKLNFQIQDGVDVDRVVRKKDTRNKEIYAKESPEYYDAAYNTIKRLWTEFKNEYSTGHPDQAKIKRSELFDMFKSLGLSYADDSMKGFMSTNSRGLLQAKTLIANTIVLDKVINEDIAKFIQKKKSK